MKLSRLLLAIILLLVSENLLGQQRPNRLETEDSLLVLKRVYSYDFQTSTFDDIDEPYIETLWSENNEQARELFNKALRLTSAPIHERMILASYFYQTGDRSKVSMVLETCKNRRDSTSVVGVMKSYGVKLSDYPKQEE